MLTPQEWQKKVGSPYEPSKYQCDIFDWIVNGRGNAVVEAVAGSGKSSVCEMGARLISGYGCYIAFSNAVVAEIKPRLANTKMEVRTSYSLGFGAIRYCNRNVKMEVDKNKYKAMIRGLENDIKRSGGFLFGRKLSNEEMKEIKGNNEKIFLPLGTILKLFDLARLDLVDFEGDDYPNVLWDLANHHNIDLPDYLDNVIADIIKHLAKIGKNTISIVDFTDMIWLPYVNNYQPKRYPWIFVDECQDTSPAQLALIKKCTKRGGRMLFVGDRCQPAGTMVAIPSKQDVHPYYTKQKITHIPIEKLKEGMKVVSCDMRSTSFIQNGKKILGITKRPYKGNLIIVESDGDESRYTPNHKCIAKFSKLRGKYCVYLMEKENSFRIGKCKLDYGSCGSGPASRARAEGAERLWILEIYDSAKEAAIWEQEISGRFGIPQLAFKRNCEIKYLNEAGLKKAWDFVGDKWLEATKCLKYFGRNWLYPLFDFSIKGKQTSLKRPMQVYACNLIDGVEVLHYEGKGHYKASQWKQAKIYREPYNGFVYSMDVEKYEVYVADGILTHNCQAIFGFAGANAKSFQQIVHETKAKLLPLSICYRCPSSGIDIAKQWVPQIETRPDAPKGTIQNIKYDQMKEMVQEGDMVLCRKNAPLVAAAFSIIAKGIPAVVKGRSIGEGLLKIVKKLGKTESFTNFGKALNDWLEKEKNIIMTRGGDEDAIEQKITYLQDTADCLSIIYQREEVNTLTELENAVLDLFSDERSSVTLSSIHRAKGLENDRIFILGPTQIVFRGQREWMREQEKNLSYVAHTRHKQDLIYVAEK